MNRPWKSGLGAALIVLGMLLLVPGILIATFEGAAYDVGLHIRIHESLGSAEAAGISEEEMRTESGALIDYIRGRRDDFPAIATAGGVPLVGQTMARHMVDVRMLFDLAVTVRTGLLVAGLLLSIAGCAASGTRWAKGIKTGGLIAVAAWTALLGAAAVYGMIDFNGLFLRFHGLMFTNDLWLLNPATDPIIKMLSEEFFLTVAARAALYMGGAMIALVVLACLPNWLVKRRTK